MDNNEMEVVKQLIEWHKSQVEQLKMVTETHSDAGINIGGISIEPGTDMHKGFQVGVLASLSLLGELPLKLEKKCKHVWKSPDLSTCEKCGDKDWM